ncbi:MAG: UbiD family decarboxylase [Rikenellaceae bacterium]
MYKNLGEYVSLLEAKGELLRIKIPVSTTLEITEITDRFSKEEGGGKALLFEKTDTDFPVLTNMMGSDRRIAMALGVDDVDEFTVKIDALFSDAMSPKKSFFDSSRCYLSWLRHHGGSLDAKAEWGSVNKWCGKVKRLCFHVCLFYFALHTMVGVLSLFHLSIV